MKAAIVLFAALALTACSQSEPSDQAPEKAADQAKKPDLAKTDLSRPSRAKAATLVGKKAPDFKLPDLAGKEVALSSYAGKTVVLEWFNPQCPYVKAAHGPGSLKDAAARHTKNGIVWLAINSGAPGKQGHDPKVNQEAKTKWKLDHPILRDPEGTIGRQYGATNTPQMVVINKDGNVVYAGAIDNSPDGEGQSPTGGKLINYVDQALADLAAGKPVKTPTTKAYGCSVKYSS